MPARRCSTCGISYPPALTECQVCGDATAYLSNEDPHDCWQETVDAAKRAQAEAGVFRTTDDQVTRWRREQFVRCGLDEHRAEHFAPLRVPETGGWRVDLNRFRELVAQGCTPQVAIDILV